MNNDYKLNAAAKELGVFKQISNIWGNFLFFIPLFSFVALIITFIFKVLIINALVMEVAYQDVVLKIADINGFIWFAIAFVFSVVTAVKMSNKNVLIEILNDCF